MPPPRLFYHFGHTGTLVGSEPWQALRAHRRLFPQKNATSRVNKLASGVRASLIVECVNCYTNVEVKKNPQMLLGRCEFGRDNYNLNIVKVLRQPGEEPDFGELITRSERPA